jgi:hypothetical protein
MNIDIFLSRLKIRQLQTLVDRYQLKVLYIPMHRKRDMMEKTLTKYIKENGIGECPICFEPNNCTIAVSTSCTHIFCDICLLTHLLKNHTCPMCREPAEYIEILKQISTYRMCKLNHILYKTHIEPEIEPVRQPELDLILHRTNIIERITIISANIYINCINIIIVFGLICNILIMQIFFTTYDQI